ncbi:hypothetical protein [Streptomyces sp. NPDC006355]|uniref:hypothetical protein n=1 Tax=Streptomyces sp. NPDC006355 TaxID=3156758 RepID=UPI00339DD3BF
MPFIKVEYSSSHNISVQGVDYIEIDQEALDENGQVPEKLIQEVWQEAVNEFMADTYAEVVENEGD